MFILIDMLIVCAEEDAYVFVADVNKIDKVTLAAGRGFENHFIQVNL